MINPRYWIRHALVRRALRNYPFYDVPHKCAESTLREEEVQENFAYFLRVRLERLAFFREWLRRHFLLRAGLDGEGLRKLSCWIDTHGGGLVGDERDRMTIYCTYQPRWEGAYAGYNVMLDVGIFLGEYLIAKRPKLYWEVYRGYEGEPYYRPEDEAETSEFGDYLRPCLGGMPRLFKAFPVLTGYGVVANGRDLATINYPASRDSLVRSAKSALYKSNIPEGTGPFIFGDSRHEPL